jgi:hypothetical protein
MMAEGTTSMSAVEQAVHMGLMGLLVSVVAPAVVLLARRGRVGLDRLALPGLVALPAFALLHGLVTLGAEAHVEGCCRSGSPPSRSPGGGSPTRNATRAVLMFLIATSG